MEIREIVDDYNRKRGRAESPRGRKKSGLPLHVEAMRVGAGLASLVHSHTDSSSAAGGIALSSHPQYGFFATLLGNTERPDDPLSLLSVSGFPDIEKYHEGRQKSLARREKVQEDLDEHERLLERLREMEDPESWGAKAASLISEAREARQAAQPKPALNPWTQAVNLLRGLPAYQNYQTVVNNFMADPGELFRLAGLVAKTLKERPSAYYFSMSEKATPVEEQNVRAALRYITWNVLFNGARVAEIASGVEKKTLSAPFLQPPHDLVVYESETGGNAAKSKTISPAVDGDILMDVLRKLDLQLPFGTMKDATDLQAYFMRNNASNIQQVLVGLNSTLTSEQDPLVELDMRAEELLKERADIQLQASVQTSPYPYLETLTQWVETVFERERNDLASQMIDLSDAIRTSIKNAKDRGETMWDRPIDLLEMSEVVVPREGGLPFRPRVVSAMNRVLAEVNKSIGEEGRRAVTVEYLQHLAGPAIAEKFAYATSRQMTATTLSTRASMTSIQRIATDTDTAAAIAGVCVAILEN